MSLDAIKAARPLGEAKKRQAHRESFFTKKDVDTRKRIRFYAKGGLIECTRLVMSAGGTYKPERYTQRINPYSLALFMKDEAGVYLYELPSTNGFRHDIGTYCCKLHSMEVDVYDFI